MVAPRPWRPRLAGWCDGLGNAVLDVLLADGFLAHARSMGELLFAQIVRLGEAHRDIVADVRGAGLMIGVKCVPPAAEVISACRNAGLLTVPAGDNVMRLLPPLIIEENHIQEAVAKMEEALIALAGK